jgi:hypothetical protein
VFWLGINVGVLTSELGGYAGYSNDGYGYTNNADMGYYHHYYQQDMMNQDPSYYDQVGPQYMAPATGKTTATGVKTK